MKAYIFPGQGAQFSGMGKDLFENSKTAYELFNNANEILGFKISDVMFNGSAWNYPLYFKKSWWK